ncbi:MAG: ribosomal-processing cysteine protease Prp [Mollicutes bacterium]|nr:MAG: ribosomal-processing cysteine protease Prp [Mollicutes bacterium]
MIKIKIEKTDKFQVSQIIVEGHADIKKNKQNPVCSAISAVVLGTVNTVNTIELNK